jgi:hypothetical protein
VSYFSGRTRGVRVIFCCWQGFYLTKLYTWLVHATMMPVKVRKTFHQERLCIENFLLEHVDWYRMLAVYGIFCTDWEKTGAHIDIICERDVWLSFCVVIQKIVLYCVLYLLHSCIVLHCCAHNLVCKFRENKISYNYIFMKFPLKGCVYCVCVLVYKYMLYMWWQYDREGWALSSIWGVH